MIIQVASVHKLIDVSHVLKSMFLQVVYD